MSDFFPLDGVALPQLSTTWPGESVEMPNVSPGHTAVSPNSGDTCTPAPSQPRAVENVRRYSAYPRGSAAEKKLTYAIPESPPDTCITCGTFSWSGGTWNVRPVRNQVRPSV